MGKKQNKPWFWWGEPGRKEMTLTGTFLSSQRPREEAHRVTVTKTMLPRGQGAEETCLQHTWLLSWLKSRQYVETLWQAEVYFLLFPFLSLFSAPNTLRSVPSCVKSSALISTLLVAIQETQSFLGCHERANPAVPWSPVLWDRSLLSWVLQTTTPLSPCSTHKSTRHW